MKTDLFTIIRVIILILGILLFAWSFIPALITFHFHIGVLTGIGLSVLMILYGIWGREVNRVISVVWKSTAGKIIEILLLVVCAGILALAAVTAAAMISGMSRTAQPGCTVIVLGARAYDNRPSLSMETRLKAAFRYLSDNPDSVCIVSGGKGSNETCTEASVMYDYLTRRGIEESRIYQEDQSTDTMENIAFSMEIMEEYGLNPEAAIATNGYHMYRALQYAQKAGLNAGAVPAPTVWWLLPTSVIREMYGILEQWFLN